MQHATVAQNDEALVETISVAVRFEEDLLAPIANDIANLSSQGDYRNGTQQRCRFWARERNPVLAKDRAHDKRVAVIGPNEPSTPVIEIPKVPNGVAPPFAVLRLKVPKA